jgi:hypothetical protein
VKRDLPKTWYSVRFIFVHTPADPAEPTTYQERITVWLASSVDEAFKRAEIEAKAYVQTLDPQRWALHEVALEQSYLHVGELGDGSEVFSQIRNSTLRPDQYISMYTDAGSHRTIEQ